MGLREIEEDLLRLFRGELEQAGVTLLDVEARTGNGLSLRFIIDSPDGVNVEDCMRIDRLVEANLLEDERMPEQFSVEVTSPGLERQLRRREEYDHFRGRLARIHTLQAPSEPREYQGILEGTAEEDLLLNVDGETVHISLETVTKAKLLFEEKKGTASGRKR